MLFGTTVYGYMIASIAALISSLNRTAMISQDRILEITGRYFSVLCISLYLSLILSFIAHLQERKTPAELSREILKHFNYMFEQRTAYDEPGILGIYSYIVSNELSEF